MARDIKLQLLLTPEGARPENAARLDQQLEQHRLKVTSKGRVTASAVIDDAAFREIFGRDAPATSAGFVSSLSEGDVNVPDTLKDLIANISLTPRHETM